MSKLPAIADPYPTLDGLYESVRSLKIAVETLAGQRAGGGSLQRYVQDTEPVDPNKGDIWANTADAGRTFYYNGSFWVDISDSRFSTIEKRLGASVNDRGQLVFGDDSLDWEAIKKDADLIDQEIQAAIEKARSDFNDAREELEQVRAELDADLQEALTNLDNAFDELAAISQTVESYKAETDGSVASLETRVGVWTDGTKSIAGRVLDIIARVGEGTASFSDEIVARVDSTSALAGRVTTVESTLGPGGATLKDSVVTQVNTTSALAGRVSTVESTLGPNGSTFRDSVVTEVNTTSALAGRVSTMEATFGPGGATFRDDVIQRVNTTSALAGRVTTMEATLGPSGATFRDDIITRVNTTGALAGRVQTIESNYVTDTNLTTNYPTKSTVTSEIYAATGPNSSLASQINTVSSTANGASSTASQALSAVNGEKAEWKVTFGDIGGELRLTGAKKVVNGVTQTSNLFYIRANVMIEGSLLVTDSITVNTDGSSPIAQNAITEGATGNGNGSASCQIMAKKAGDIFIVIGSYAGGSTSAANGFGFGGNVSGNMVFNVNGNWDFAIVPIRGFMYNASVLFGVITNYFATAATTYTTAVTAAGPGLHTFTVTTGLAQTTTISVFRLSK